MSQSISLKLVKPAAVALALATPGAVPLKLAGTGAIQLQLTGQGTFDADPSRPPGLSLEFQKFLAGSDGDGQAIERSLLVDASRPIAYVGYSSRIVRLDYATWPPVETTASTTNVHADWPNRASLEYA